MEITGSSDFGIRRSRRYLFQWMAWLCLAAAFAEMAHGGDAITVMGAIEKINLLDRTMTISIAGNEPSIELELTRKTKIFFRAVPAGADAIKVGSKAKIKYNADLMVAFSIEADPQLEILNLEELNSSQKDFSPWVSPDGLEIFWATDSHDKKPTIWHARRRTPESIFGDKKQFYFGHSPVLSSDCLQILFRNPELDGIYTSTRNSRDDDFSRPVKVPSLAFPHLAAAPTWLTDDGLTLYLDMVNSDVLNNKDVDSGDDDDEFEAVNAKSTGTAGSGKAKKDGGSSYRVCWVSTRETVNSEWQRPTIVQIEFEGKPKDFGFNFAAGTPDNLRLFCVSNHGLGMLSRSKPSGPFTHWDEIRITTPDGHTPFCQRIQYVAATHELFLASNNLFSNPALKRKRWMDLWVVKDFTPPSGAPQK